MAIDSFFISLCLILLFGRILGEVCCRTGSPTVVGEILAGILIGPSVFAWVEPQATLALMAELGIILLLFDIGCQTSIKRLIHAGGRSFWVALVGILAPAIVAGISAAYWLNLPPFTALFFGCALTATSIGIPVRVLTQAKQEQTQSGHVILGAAVLDDLVGVVLLSMLFKSSSSGSLSLAEASLQTLMVVSILIFAPPLARALIYLFRALQPCSKHYGYEAVVVVMLISLFAWLVHWFGAPALLGGFAVGMAFSRQFVSPMHRFLRNPFHFTQKLEEASKPLIHVFSPIFFVYVGISLDLSQLDISWSGLLLLSWLAIIAIVTKLVAGFAASGPWREKMIIGTAMIPRGEVGLVFAELGYQMGVIQPKLFTELVLVIAITTIIGPMLLMLALKTPSQTQ